MSNRVFMYGDQETVDILNEDIPKVILFGGYLGFNNFGDILQLKEAIKFHSNVTSLEPIVICHVSSIPDKDFLTRLRTWFGCRAFIFVHDQFVDLSLSNLHLIDTVFQVENLHVYGGGFLNRYWGNHFLKLIEGLLDNFKVVNYALSGQQLDVELASSLKVHFEKYRPKLIGVRDFESQKIVNSVGFQCEFSFDDASNIIEAWARRKPQISTKCALFTHFNTSEYVWHNGDDQRNMLEWITQILITVAAKFKDFEPVFLSAYSECRFAVKDTLATIVSMEDALPFMDYRVLDIAHMALLHDPYSSAIDGNLAVFGGGVAISSSYHTAMFCNMLGIPCYLMSNNEYYKQKQEGLGENRTLDQFLENPSVLSYSEFMTQRADWLKKLASFFGNVDSSRVRKTISLNYFEPSISPAPFRFKEVSAIERENYSLKSELSKILVVLNEKKELIERLEKELNMFKGGNKADRTSLIMQATSLLRQFIGIQRK